MAQNINIENIEQFTQCLLDLQSPANQQRMDAEQAIRALEANNPDPYVAYLLGTLAAQEGTVMAMAGILLKNLLKKDAVNHSLYDSIFETLFNVSGKWRGWTMDRRFFHPLLCYAVKNQLTRNNETLFNKYIALFDSDNPNHVNYALSASALLLEERGDLLEAFHNENSARLHLVLDKLILLLKLDRSEYARELFHTLNVAVQEETGYFMNEPVRTLVLQKVLELIDKGVSFGYTILGSGLGLYEHFEPYMERIINGMSKVDTSPSLVAGLNDNTSEGHLEIIVNFWMDFCDAEKNRQAAHEEFSKYEISAPENIYLGLLQRYGDKVLNELILLPKRLEITVEFEDHYWYGPYLQCIADIANAVNISISPYADKIDVSRATLLLDARTHWTETLAKITPDSYNSGADRYYIQLRLSPSFLVDALDSDWDGLEYPTTLGEIKANFVSSAAEYLPMYDKSVQKKCIKFACERVNAAENNPLDSFAEMLRLPLVKKEYSDFVIKNLQQQPMGFEEQREQEFKCYNYLAQLYNVPEEALQLFINNVTGFDSRDPMTLYHLIKPVQDLKQVEEIFENPINIELEKEGDKYDETLLLLGLVCQKIGSKISSGMYSEILRRLRALSYKSYHIFDTMASIVPPAGVSYLSHLESMIDLFEKKVQSHVSDDVFVEYAIRGLTALLQSFKKSSNEFLFIGQIKRIVSALQPALEPDREPSEETLRAYLTFIRELYALEQGSITLRSLPVQSVLQRASESRDRHTKHLALSVVKLFADK